MGFFDTLLDKFSRTKPKIGLFPEEFRPQLERARNELQIKTSTHDRLFQIASAAWDVDQDAGTIVFTSPDGIRAVAPVQIVGTYDSAAQTWLWAWDHPSVDSALAEHARRMREFGAEHGLPALTKRTFGCNEDECWDLTALACMVCEGQGAYRGPSGATRVFLTFGSVTLSKVG